MDASVKARTETAQALHQAIINNEFETHYQPKFDLKSGELYGFESLIRWKHPERGLIPPDQFIPVAESTGTDRQDWGLDTSGQLPARTHLA